MKTRSLSVLAGLGTLILAPSASAGFLAIDVVSKEVDPTDFVDPTLRLFVCNIYATFDTRDGDFARAVAGFNTDSPLSIRVQDGIFYQHPAGGDTAPPPKLISQFPSLAFDSFVTIGKKTSTGDETELSIGWPGFSPSELGGCQDNNEDGTPDGENIHWLVHHCEQQGFPGQGGDNPPNQVLLGQFTVDANDPANIGVGGFEGEFMLAGESNNIVFQEYLSFKHAIAPCPWDLDGNGVVAVPDLLALLAAWGTDPGGPPDFDGDGDVGVEDLVELLANWGPCIECGSPNAGSCFEENGTPFCDHSLCCRVVCDDHPPCCEDEWGPLCVELANACPVCGTSGSCYEEHSPPGCSDAQCCLTVCSLFLFCCEVAWDDTCVGLAELFCEEP